MVWATLQEAQAEDAMTFALPGTEGSYALEPATEDPFMHQELIEMLYHTLWETVHVFFEHRELGHDLGETQFSVSIPRPGEARHRRSDRGSGEFHSDEGPQTIPNCGRELGGSNPNRSATVALASAGTFAARREADSVWQWRLGDGCERLGNRLRASTRWISGDPRGFVIEWSPPTSRRWRMTWGPT